MTRPGASGGRGTRNPSADERHERAERIDGGAADADFEVQMRPGCISARADAPENGAARHLLADPHVDRREMGIERADAARVPDDDEPPPPAGAPSSPGHRPRRGGEHRRPARCKQIDPGVEGIAARAEPVADGREHGPDERDRRARERPGERAQRRPAGDARRRQPCAALEPAHCACDAWAEAAVDDAGRKAVPGELELQRTDALTGRSAAKRRTGYPRNEQYDNRGDEQDAAHAGTVRAHAPPRQKFFRRTAGGIPPVRPNGNGARPSTLLVAGAPVHP